MATYATTTLYNGGSFVDEIKHDDANSIRDLRLDASDTGVARNGKAIDLVEFTPKEGLRATTHKVAITGTVADAVIDLSITNQIDDTEAEQQLSLGVPIGFTLVVKTRKKISNLVDPE